MLRKLIKRLKFFVSLLIVAVLGIWYFSYSNPNVNDVNSTVSVSGNKIMSVVFMDVGQGDCTFVTLPDNKTLLIDGANNGDGQSILSYLKELNVERLDYIVATHPHADHIGGLPYIINNIDVGEVFAPKIYSQDIPTTKTYENFLLSVKNKGKKISAAKGGQTLFEGEGYKGECFSPNSDRNDGLNNYSVVLKLTFGNDSFLFTGDAEAETEKEMLEKGYNLDSDVLKLGHHGSSTSSSKEFLTAVSPKYGVISCGRNNTYGHPHNETISAIKAIKGFSELYRTDTQKTITALSKGNGNIVFKTGGKTIVTED